MNIVELYKDDILDLITLGTKYSSFNEDNGDYIKMQIRDVDSDDILYTFYSNRLLLEYEIGDYYFGDYHYTSEHGFMEGIEHTKESHNILLPTHHILGNTTEYTMKKQFNIYKDGNNKIYIKPNEILGKVNLEENNYKLVLYFLQDIRSLMNDTDYDDWVEKENVRILAEELARKLLEEEVEVEVQEDIQLPPQSSLPNLIPNGHMLDWPVSIKPPTGWSNWRLPHVEMVDGPSDTPGIRIKNNTGKGLPAGSPQTVGGTVSVGYFWLEAGATYILSGSGRASGPLGNNDRFNGHYKPRIKLHDNRRNYATGITSGELGYGYTDQTHTKVTSAGIVSNTQLNSLHDHPSHTPDNPHDTRVIDAVWTIPVVAESTKWVQFSTEFTPITNYLERMDWDTLNPHNTYFEGNTTEISAIRTEAGQPWGGCAVILSLYAPSPQKLTADSWVPLTAGDDNIAEGQIYWDRDIAYYMPENGDFYQEYIYTNGKWVKEGDRFQSLTNPTTGPVIHSTSQLPPDREEQAMDGTVSAGAETVWVDDTDDNDSWIDYANLTLVKKE